MRVVAYRFFAAVISSKAAKSVTRVADLGIIAGVMVVRHDLDDAFGSLVAYSRLTGPCLHLRDRERTQTRDGTKERYAIEVRHHDCDEPDTFSSGLCEFRGKTKPWRKRVTKKNSANRASGEV